MPAAVVVVLSEVAVGAVEVAAVALPPPCRGERERVRGRARACGGRGHNVSGRHTLP